MTQPTGGSGPRLADAVLDRLREALADRYELLRELGRGGMATVYVARDRKHDREVALKVMDPSLARGVGAARFVREVRIAATLTHPGIVPVFDSGEVGDTFYYVMPLMRGASLRDRMRSGPIAPRDACLLLAEVADALDAAHRAHVVHRDIKPENILIADGRPLVTDFGVAHAALSGESGESLTDTGVSVGTLLYMAPEQLFDAAKTDARADVFSVGAMLYEMLSGAPPFTAPTMPAAMARLAAESTPRLPATVPVSAELRSVVGRATARDPDDRFASARELADALRAAAMAEPVSSSAPRLVAGPARRMSRRAVTGAFLALLVLIVAAGIVRHVRGGRTRADASPPSLAVLSFENTSHDPKLAYFSDGITQELQNALAELPGLSVASRTATDVWRGRAADPRDIAHALGVTDLLEGGVARTQDSVRIYVRLVDGRTGRQRWRGRYDRRLADLFDVQEDVARSVAGELRVALAEGGATAIARSRTASIEAHDLVLRANYELRGSHVSELERAVAMADSALALVPDYAPAWASKARALSYLALFRGRRSSDVPRQARDAAARAVELDSLSADAQMSYGVLLFRYDWRWADAERHLQRAIALNPSLVDAHRQLSRVLRSLGRFGEARAANLAAFRIDPGERSRALSFGRISYFARDYERAIRETRESPDTTLPSYLTWLGEAYMQAGNLAAAESLLTRDTTQAALGILLAKTGRAPRALEILARAERDREWTLEEIAEVYVALGDHARALDRLEQAVAEHDPLVVDFLVRPALDPVRSEPRFQALMRKLAFPSAAKFER